jgi:hypothetical protein
MAITVTKSSGTFESNPMDSGMNAAVITDLAERDVPNFDDKSKMDRKIVARFVTADGKEASRFYTPSLHEKATLVKDLISLGVFKANAIPAQIPDLEKILVGRQCVVFTTEGTNQKTGAKTAKISALAPAPASQKVVAPGKGGAVATPKPAARKAAAPPPSDIEDGTEITSDDIPF